MIVSCFAALARSRKGPRGVPAVPGSRPGAIRSVTVQTGDTGPARGPRVRRRDRHGRGLRGRLVPPGIPLYRSRAQQFDDLVLDAVARLEPRWETELSAVEFAVQEVPDEEDMADDPGEVPLARAIPGSPDAGDPARPASAARIVLYRRPLLERADDEDELGELVFDVVVEEFAQLLGLDPETIDPGYSEPD